MRRATKWASQIFSNRFFGMGGPYPCGPRASLVVCGGGLFWARSEAMASALKRARNRRHAHIVLREAGPRSAYHRSGIDEGVSRPPRRVHVGAPDHEKEQRPERVP